MNFSFSLWEIPGLCLTKNDPVQEEKLPEEE